MRISDWSSDVCSSDLSNPVDLMAMIAFDCAGLPASRIIGTGTLLDSSRLRTLLAGELDVAPGSVDALVLGEHGDSEVGLMSRSEERRVGKECVRTCRSRWSPDP